MSYEDAINQYISTIDNSDKTPASIAIAIKYSQAFSPIRTIENGVLVPIKMKHPIDYLEASMEKITAKYLFILSGSIVYAVILSIAAIALIVLFALHYQTPIAITDGFELSGYNYICYQISLGHFNISIAFVATIIECLAIMIGAIQIMRILEELKAKTRDINKHMFFDQSKNNTLMLYRYHKLNTIEEYTNDIDTLMSSHKEWSTSHKSIYIAQAIDNCVYDSKETINDLLSNKIVSQSQYNPNNCCKNIKLAMAFLLRSPFISSPESIQKQINEIRGQCSRSNEKGVVVTSYCFITFSKPLAKQNAYRYLKSIHSPVYQVSHSDYVWDIQWINLKYTESQRMFWLTIVILISILIGIAIIGANIFITFVLTRLEAKMETMSFLTYNLCEQGLSIGIEVINLICIVIIEMVYKLSKCITESGYDAQRTYFSIGFNSVVSIVIPFVANFIRESKGTMQELIFDVDGLLGRVVSNWISLALVPSVLELLNPRVLFHFLQMQIIKKTSISQWLTQMQLNKIAEKPIIYYSDNYSNIVILILYSCAHITLFPAGAMLTFIGLTFYFFACKFMITNAYCTTRHKYDSLSTSIVTALIFLAPSTFIIFNTVYMILLTKSLTQIICSLAISASSLGIISVCYCYRQRLLDALHTIGISTRMNYDRNLGIKTINEFNPLIIKSLSPQEMNQYQEEAKEHAPIENDEIINPYKENKFHFRNRPAEYLIL